VENVDFMTVLYITCTIVFSWKLSVRCSVVRFELGLGLDLVSGWLVVMHTYFRHRPLLSVV